MFMKKVLVAILMFVYSFFGIAQEKEDISLLVTEDSWRKEAFRFPIPFAKEIDFNGVADVRFTKGWEDTNSPNFWSYAFAWKIVLEERLTDSEIEKYMQIYFDGLMNVVNKDKSKPVPPTQASFTSIKSTEAINYMGEIMVYDAFFTQEMMTLNIQGRYSYCKEQDTSIYIFKLSPQEFDNTVWQHINKTVLRSDICKVVLKEK